MSMLLIATIMTGAANAQGITVEGILDCGQWVRARTEKNSTAIGHYVIGVINGLAIGKGVEFWRAGGINISTEAIYLWMDGYCRQHPLNQVFEGAFALYKERSGWRP